MWNDLKSIVYAFGFLNLFVLNVMVWLWLGHNVMGLP